MAMKLSGCMLLSVLAFGLGAIGCGGGSAPDTHSTASGGSGGHSIVAAGSTQSRASHYLNDSDADPIDDEDGDNRHDVDKDPSLDYQAENDNEVHVDRDDRMTIMLGGSEADAADRRSIEALVKRYFAAAATGNGRAACATFLAFEARKIPAYVRDGTVPAYVRGAKSCAAAMTRVFRRFRHQLSTPVTVTDVRVRADGAGLAVLGSTTMPAGYLSLHRQRGAWWIQVPTRGISLLDNEPN